MLSILLLPKFSLITINHKKPIFQLLSPSSLSSSFIVRGTEKDSQKFEIDPDEAKKALEKLDQQIQTLSKKKTSTPKIKASDVKLTRDEADENSLEISGSFLAYTAIALLIFTIFYNILFYAVIKPAVDGPDDIPAMKTAPATTVATESPSAKSFAGTGGLIPINNEM